MVGDVRNFCIGFTASTGSLVANNEREETWRKPWLILRTIPVCTQRNEENTISSVGPNFHSADP